MTSISNVLLQEAERLGFGDIHFKLDPATQLYAIVAIHNTKLGPALGGCRCREYNSLEDAIHDALRLARGMTYKSAIANLPLGGGKAVIVKPKHIVDRTAYFKAFGRFVNELGGRYITACDSGTNPTDMDVIATQTRFVTTTSNHDGNPAPFTAKGVCYGIQAAVKTKYDRDPNDLTGLHVAIQGVGSVGFGLVKELKQLNATITVCDKDTDALQQCVQEFQVKVVEPHEIYQVDCDIFAPCALGAVLNDETIPALKATIVAGAANNQLAEARHGRMLHDRGILYAPDYLINAGGVVHAYVGYGNISPAEADQRIAHIYEQTLEVFARAKRENRLPDEIVDTIAEERFR